ncbi:class I SAM-dependent methyltransferase [Olivibacter sp. SDN3]|uniref:SAM-dependent methyltransferase n=1 Tax=Olivibacter sp. SDN3 TaxID=2764720 RepID=UPI00165186C0|nr:class I SAM-dependent methyltransferase [Olivibacter sp. SDN3]QNL50793.1 class I SAM-dependent methyltransferase [Olivibacter sp. SDN3]
MNQTYSTNRRIKLSMPRFLLSSILMLLGSFGAFAQSSYETLDVPYVPTKPAVVEAMLNMAKVNKNDVIYDLGCGDGRIVITAAKKYGATGVGVDIDPQRIEEANANLKKEGLTDKVKFIESDLFKVDFSNASVVTLYLLPDVNLRLRSKLLETLKPGTRIVSHAFDMGDWKPEKQINVEGSTIYFWTVPEKK